MSELLDRLKPSISAAEISRRLVEAQYQLDDLSAQHGQAALDKVSGIEGADTHLNTIVAQLGETREKIATLKAAHGVAVAREEKAAAASRAAIQRTQINAVRSHLSARDKAAEELSAALTQAAASWRTLLERSGKAAAANPIGGQWPVTALCSLGQLKKLVEIELYRVGGDPSLTGAKTFPGGNPHDMRLLGQPETIPPLADALKKATAHTLAVLTGQVRE